MKNSRHDRENVLLDVSLKVLELVRRARIRDHTNTFPWKRQAVEDKEALSNDSAVFNTA